MLFFRLIKKNLKDYY